MSTEPLEILLVEDDAATAIEIQQSLSALGHLVTYTATGDQALGAVQRRKPQLAIVATTLAGAINGQETARRLAGAGIPLLFLAASLREAKPLLDLKPVGGLVKPLREGEAEMVLSLAQNLLAEREQMREQSNLISQVVDSLADGVFLIDRGRNIVFANATALKLAHSELPSGQPLDDFFKLTLPDNINLASAVYSVLDGTSAIVENIRAVLRAGDGAEVAMTVGVASAGSAGVSIRFAPAPAVQKKEKAVEEPAAEQVVLDPNSPSQAPLREKAIRAIELRLESKSSANHYAAVFVLSQFDNFRTRYGQTNAETLVEAYSAHLTKSFPEDRIYRWSGRTVAVVLERNYAPPEVRMELTSFATRRVDYYLNSNGRSALVTLSAQWHLIPLNCDPDSVRDTEEVVAMIDQFERDHTRKS